MAERADYLPPLTRWDCMQPDPNEGLVCERCEGRGRVAEWEGDFHGTLYRTGTVDCPDCHGTGKP